MSEDQDVARRRREVLAATANLKSAKARYSRAMAAWARARGDAPPAPTREALEGAQGAQRVDVRKPEGSS